MAICLNREIYISVFRYIGTAVIDHFLNEGNDIIHGFRNPWCNIRKLRIQLCTQILIGIDITLCNDCLCRIFLNCLIDDLIIDIGKIGYIGYLVSFCFKQSFQHIKDDHRSGIADMCIVIHSRSTYIHADMSFPNRCKRFNL